MIKQSKRTHNTKRILSVKIIRQVDTDPDTSYLGEYSNRRTSEYSIDRLHSEDCAIHFLIPETARQILRNARAYVVGLQDEVLAESKGHVPTYEYEELEDAYNTLDQLADDSPECDCGERGDMQRNEYRYFNPSFNYIDKTGKALETPENVRKYTRQDYERMERLNRGDWCYIGIHADAEIGIPQNPARNAKTDSGVYTVQTIRSGGLWGTESDSDESHLKSIEQEELSELRAQLKAIGFSTRAISAAFKNVTEVSE
jgi:hypothetical protein